MYSQALTYFLVYDVEAGFCRGLENAGDYLMNPTGYTHKALSEHLHQTRYGPAQKVMSTQENMYLHPSTSTYANTHRAAQK